MERDRWNRAQELLRAALDLEPAKRAAFLNHECGSDAALRQEVDSLLAQHSQTGAFDELHDKVQDATVPTELDRLTQLRNALGDRYSVERKVGAGGMATVYLAQDLKHQRKVAIKVLNSGITAALGAKRFLQEVRITAQLSHPHILPLLDSGKADGFLFYVMPFVEGESLRDRLNREKQFPLDDAVQITREIASALAYAHDHNVVHRDIKPENIMLSGNVATLADFGIAQAVSQAGGGRLTESGTAIGTPLYMSPEQASGEQQLDGRSDIYALGCVLYEMLAGQPPFTGPTAESVARQHIAAEPRPVTEIRPGVPQSVATVISRTLAKPPADRFPAASNLIDALLRAMVEPVSASDVEDVSTAKRQSKVLALAGATVLVVGSLAIAAFGLIGRDSRSAGAGAPLGPAIAVAPPVNRTGDTNIDLSSDVIGLNLTKQLELQGQLAVIPWEVTGLAWKHVQSEAAAGRIRDPAAAFADETGASIVVTGALYSANDSLRLEMAIRDASQGAINYATHVLTTTEDSLWATVSTAGPRLLGSLALLLDERLDAPYAQRMVSQEVARLIIEGLDRQVAFDFDSSATLALAAYLKDTTDVRLLIVAAASLSNMSTSLSTEYKRVQADSILEYLLAKRVGDLAPPDLASARMWHKWIHSDIEGALQEGREIARWSPGSWNAVNWAWIASRDNRPYEAMEAWRTIRLERGPCRGFWPCWIMWCEILHKVAKFDEELRCTHALPERYTPLGGDLLRARVPAALGDTATAWEVVRHSGYPYPVALWIHHELCEHGFCSLSAPFLQFVIEQFERRRTNGAQLNMGDRGAYAEALLLFGRLETARQEFKELRRESSDDVRWLGFLGQLAAMQNDVRSAAAIADTLSTVPDLMGSDFYGGPTIERARIMARLGRVSDVVNLLRQAFEEEAVQVNAGFLSDPAFSDLWGDPRFEQFRKMKDEPPDRETRIADFIRRN